MKDALLKFACWHNLENEWINAWEKIHEFSTISEKQLLSGLSTDKLNCGGILINLTG